MNLKFPFQYAGLTPEDHMDSGVWVFGKNGEEASSY